MTPNLNPSPELLPCPFCGGQKLLQAQTHATSDFTYWSVECLDCGAEIGDDEGQANADKHWNTRALSPQTLPAPGEVDKRHWQQAIGNEIARQCGIGAGTCGNADDGSGLFEVDASLDLNGFAAAMKEASPATVAAANDEGVAEQAAQFADGVAEGAQSLYALAARDRDTVGTLIHGEAVRVAKHIAAAIRLLSQGWGK